MRRLLDPVGSLLASLTALGLASVGHEVAAGTWLCAAVLFRIAAKMDDRT